MHKGIYEVGKDLYLRGIIPSTPKERVAVRYFRYCYFKKPNWSGVVLASQKTLLYRHSFGEGWFYTKSSKGMELWEYLKSLQWYETKPDIWQSGFVNIDVARHEIWHDKSSKTRTKLVGYLDDWIKYFKRI